MVYPVDNVIHNLKNWACRVREVPALPICFPFRGFWRFSRTKSNFRRTKISHINRAELLLPSGRLPGTCEWNSRFLHTDVTPGSYGKLQNLLIKAYTIAHHVWGNTCPLSTAHIFLFIWHFFANTTNTPRSRIIPCWFLSRRIPIQVTASR